MITGITTPGQSIHKNNGNEGILHISETLKLVPHNQMQFIGSESNGMKVTLLLNELELICLYTVKWFQVM